MFKILLTAATLPEIAPVLDWLRVHFRQEENGIFHFGGRAIIPCITGIGLTATAWHLSRALLTVRPHWAIQAGIAGAFDRNLALGDVVSVVSEQLCHLGAEEQDGSITDVFDLGLMSPDEPPFFQKKLHNPAAASAAFLPTVHGLTVHTVHGQSASVEKARQKYPEVQIESMEGAAFFYGCLSEGLPFVEIRSISNYVEARNRAAWDIPLAIGRLNKVLIDLCAMEELSLP
jgi:futalosine hydrolase